MPDSDFANASFVGSRPPFVAVPDWLFGVASPSEGWLICTLLCFYPNTSPTVEQLARASNIAPSDVPWLINSMARKGWIEIRGNDLFVNVWEIRGDQLEVNNNG